jgi:DNA-binding transcriptional ArsR family regulator
MNPKDERALAKLKGLPVVAKAVLLALVTFTDEHGRAFPSRREIGARAGLSPRSVSTGLAWLEGAGWLTREERRRDDGGRSSDMYRVRSFTAEAKRHAAEAETRKLPLMTVMRPPHPVDNQGENQTPPLQELQGPPLQELQHSKDSTSKDLESNSDEDRRRRAEVAPLLAGLVEDMRRGRGRAA